MCPNMGGFEGFEGEDVTILCSDPPKGSTMREYASAGVCMSKSVQRPKLQVGRKILRSKK